MIPANPYTPPSFIPNSMPPLPPLHDELIKTIHKHVDDRLDEVMAGKDEKLYKEFEKYICHIMKKHTKSCSHHDTAEEEVPTIIYKEKKSPLHCLYEKIHSSQKKVQEGTPIMEVEKELHEMLPEMSHEEKRVFASLLRADGPYTLSGMIGIPYDEYKELMCKIGERLVEVEENKN